MTTQNFLVEIGTEELPPKALKTLATSFADNVEAELNQAGLSFDKIEWFAAPRRLAVKVLNLATQQPSKEIEKTWTSSVCPTHRFWNWQISPTHLTQCR